MASELRTYLVTGANRGIGLQICRLLLQPNTTRDPIRLIATSRAGSNLDLQPSENDKIHYRPLDISQQSSIDALAKSIKGVDVLINNAGINLDAQYSFDTARKTLQTNYYGTRNVCRTFLPLLRAYRDQPSRIVNVSSVASQLKAYSPEVQAKFREAVNHPTRPLQQLDALAGKYLQFVMNGTEAEKGYVGPGRAYAVSKACVNALTMILARENDSMLINACCPGWVSTEMGRSIGKAPKTEEDGAKIPVRLARGDLGGVTGQYWANESVRGTGEGEVMEWLI